MYDSPKRPAASRGRAIFLLLVILAAAGVPADAQTRSAGFTIEEVLSPAFPHALVAAKGVDRIAWIENDRGCETSTRPWRRTSRR